MSYNILADSYVASTVSGTTDSGSLSVGLFNQELSSTQLTDLVYNRATITLASGNYIGLRTQFGMDMVCSQAKIYSEYVTSGIALFSYKRFFGNVWSNSGAYNYNTD